MIFVLIVLLKTIQFYSYLLIAYALLSWFPGAYNTGFGRLLVQKHLNAKDANAVGDSKGCNT